jgi:hypothetical protein
VGLRGTFLLVAPQTKPRSSQISWPVRAKRLIQKQKDRFVLTVLITAMAVTMLYGLTWHNQSARGGDPAPSGKDPLDKLKTRGEG